MSTQSQVSSIAPINPPSKAASHAGLCVVAGLDFTDADGPAFDLAGRIVVRAPGSQIHLVHVFQHPPSAERSRDLIEHLRLYVDEKRAFAKTLSGVTVGIHLRGGEVVREIVQLATEVSADFIVVGTHPGLHVVDWLRGSTVERLVNSVAFPVLVARAAVEPAKQEPTIEPPCPDCVAARVASGGERWWCERHSHSAVGGHVYSYQREFPMATHDSAITPTGIDF
jgi:nucleotide-binding universal stress UspA family protein